MPKSFSIGFAIGAALAPSFSNVFKTAGQKIQGFQSSLKNAQIGKAVTEDLLKNKVAMDGLRERMQATGVTGANLTQRLFELQQRYNKAAGQAEKYGINVGDAARQQRFFEVTALQAERSLASLQKRQQNKAVRSEVHGQILGTVGMAMGAAAPLKAAIDFESVMADVKKVVNFDTPVAFKQMGTDILNMSRVIPMAASGIGDIVAAAGQAGIAREELLSFAQSAAKMGVAFDMTGADSGKMMADWRAGMNLTQAQVVSLGDAVNHLSNNMNANAGALGGVLQRQGAVAMSAGLTETQAAALGAALLSSGAGEERAATALKNLTGALTMGAAATKSQRDAFKALGLDATEMASAMQQDAVGAIQSVFKAITDQPIENRTAIVSQLFGEESKGAIMPLLKNMENLGKAFDLTADHTKYAGSMQKEFEERSKTTANSLNLLKNSVTAAGINIGSVFLPSLNMAVGGLTRVTGWIGTAAEKFPRVTQFVGGLALGLVTLKVAALGARYGATLLSDGWEVAKGIFNFLRPSVIATNFALVRQRVVTTALWIQTKAVAVGTQLWAGAQWLLNAAMTANPIGLVIAGVAALAAGAYFLIRNWDVVAGFFKDMWDKVKAIFSGASDWLQNTSFFKFGAKLMDTFSGGIASKNTAPANEVGKALAKADELMPHSDAKRGPFSKLTQSGMAIGSTMAEGVRKGAGPLEESLAGLMGRGARGGNATGMAGSAGGIYVTVSPTIHIAAGTDATGVRQAVDRGMTESESRIRSIFDRLVNNDKRLSFA